MSIKLKKLIYTAAVAAILFYAYKHLLPNDEKIIKQNLADIEKHLNIDKPEKYLAIIKKSKFIDKYFTENVNFTLKTKHYSHTVIIGRSELTQHYTVMHTRVKSMEVDFSNINIKIKEKNATINLKAVAKWTSFTSGKSFMEEMNLIIHMNKVEGEWIILKLSGSPVNEGPENQVALNKTSFSIE